MREQAQSLVELALVAPLLIVLAMAAWDGGSLLREQVVLQQAARDGARLAATGYGPSGVPASNVCAAVSASAADLPALACNAANITYPPGAVTVQLSYPHALFTPVLRNLWGGGTFTLRASATFYLPQQTPVPAPIVPSTPTPTPTPTLTPTPVPPTFTPTPTPTPGPRTCSLTIPALVYNNSGYYVGISVTGGGSPIAATWTSGPVGGRIDIYIYAGPPAQYLPADESNPTSKNTAPPSGDIAHNGTTSDALSMQTSGAVASGPYTLYFYKQGVPLDRTTPATLTFAGTQCPT